MMDTIILTAVKLLGGLILILFFVVVAQHLAWKIFRMLTGSTEILKALHFYNAHKQDYEQERKP